MSAAWHLNVKLHKAMFQHADSLVVPKMYVAMILLRQAPCLAPNVPRPAYAERAGSCLRSIHLAQDLDVFRQPMPALSDASMKTH